MKVMIFGPTDLTERLRDHFENMGHEVSETTADPQEVRNLVCESKAQLFVLDPNISFQTAVEAAQLGKKSDGRSVAFISPIDDIARDVLLDLHPVGILPSIPERGDVAALIAAVRAKRAEASVEKHASASREPASGSTLRIAATVSTLLAIAVGYYLPNGPPMLDGLAGYTAYFAVALLALLSIGCLLRVKRPMRASVYAAAIALVTVLPTQQ